MLRAASLAGLTLAGLAVAAPAASQSAAAAVQDTSRAAADTLRLRAPALSVIQADRATNPVTTTASELLLGRLPGVMVEPGAGLAGSGGRLWIRAPGGLLGERPLVLLDGARIEAEMNSFSIPGAAASISRLDDLPLRDVERIEVLKGPATSALYGPDAAAGVVRITTRRPTAERWSWTASVEGGGATEATAYPDVYWAVDPQSGKECPLVLQAGRDCAPGPIQRFNFLAEEGAFRSGSRLAYAVSGGGGFSRARLYLSAGREQEDGVVEPSHDERTGLRLNADAELLPGLQLQAGGSYLDREVGMPLNYLRTALHGSWQPGGGYGAPSSPQEGVLRVRPEQRAIRRIGYAALRWAPLAWLEATARVGGDNTGWDELSVQAAEMVGNPYPLLGEYRDLNRSERSLTTLGGEATLRRDGRFPAGLTLGVERVRASHGSYVASFTVDTAGAPRGSTERWSWSRQQVTALYAQPRLELGRVSLGGMVRRDENDEAGDLFDPAWSLAARAEWAVPAGLAPAGTRLWAGWGQTERYPELGLLALVPRTPPNYNPVPGPARADAPEPERLRELELGTAASAWGGRARLELTAYRRSTSDAYGPVPVPPTNGFTHVLLPVGDIENRGVEGALDLALLRRGGTALDLRLGGFVQRSRFESQEDRWLLTVSSGAAQQRIEDGRPLGAYYARRLLGWQDANGDSIIAPIACGPSDVAGCEVLLSEEAEYIGPALPTRGVSLQPALRHGGVRLAALLDYRGGHYLYNETEAWRCGFGMACEANYQGSLEEQARMAAAYLNADAQYVERADFVKLRELSLAWELPRRWLAGIRAEGAELSLAGRNLATWTGYSGFDPEVTALDGGYLARTDLFTQPPVRQWVTRLSVRF